MVCKRNFTTIPKAAYLVSKMYIDQTMWWGWNCTPEKIKISICMSQILPVSIGVTSSTSAASASAALFFFFFFFAGSSVAMVTATASLLLALPMITSSAPPLASCHWERHQSGCRRLRSGCIRLEVGDWLINHWARVRKAGRALGPCIWRQAKCKVLCSCAASVNGEHNSIAPSRVTREEVACIGEKPNKMDWPTACNAAIGILAIP